MSNLDTILMLHWFFVSHNFSSVLVEPITEFIKGEETLVYFMIGTNFYPLCEVLSHSALHRVSYFVLRQSALRCHSVNMAELWGLVPVFVWLLSIFCNFKLSFLTLLLRLSSSCLPYSVHPPKEVTKKGRRTCVLPSLSAYQLWITYVIYYSWTSVRSEWQRPCNSCWRADLRGCT